MQKIEKIIDQDNQVQPKVKWHLTQERLKEDVDSIRNWVNCQPHLPTIEDNDHTNRWIQNLVFFSKGRNEKVKKTIDYYFKCRSAIPELFDNRDPSDPAIRNNVQMLNILHLPKRTPKGYRVHYFGHITDEVGSYDPNQSLRRALMMMDLWTRREVAEGEIGIIDMKLSSLAKWSRYNINLVSKFITTALRAYILKIKAVHFVNAPAFVTSIIAIANPLISEKLKQRIKIHRTGGMDQLFEDVPRECVPLELGGTLDCTLQELNEYWYAQLVKHKDWMLSTQHLKSDESKRPPELQVDDGLFGCEGTFRNLSVD